jgi:hypothetical protein
VNKKIGPTTMPDDIVLRCDGHPAANGRHPEAGDVEYHFWFKLEGGKTLHLYMGQEERDTFRGFLLHQDLHDAATEAAKALDGAD